MNSVFNSQNNNLIAPRFSSSCIKPVSFIKLHQVSKPALMQLHIWQSTCIKPVNNLQQTCYHQAGASDVNASWYRLEDCKVASLQQIYCNLCVSRCVSDCQNLSTTRLPQVVSTNCKGQVAASLIFFLDLLQLDKIKVFLLFQNIRSFDHI